MTALHGLVLLLTVLWEILQMGGPLAIPIEIVNTLRKIEAAADKWTQVGDAIISWHMPAAFAAGFIVCWMYVSWCKTHNQ